MTPDVTTSFFFFWRVWWALSLSLPVSHRHTPTVCERQRERERRCVREGRHRERHCVRKGRILEKRRRWYEATEEEEDVCSREEEGLFKANAAHEEEEERDRATAAYGGLRARVYGAPQTKPRLQKRRGSGPGPARRRGDVLLCFMRTRECQCVLPLCSVCCFVLLEPTWMLYRVPRVSPGVTAPIRASHGARASV